MIEFSVGGFLSKNGTQILTSSSLDGPWTSLVSYPPDTNALKFTAILSPQTTATFYRASSVP